MALDPKPVDFSDPAWQQSVSDDDIKRIIVGGHVIGKSMAMPGNPDLKAKPEVVVALCEYIRQVGQR